MPVSTPIASTRSSIATRCWAPAETHTSGSSLSAQTRYAAGTREILECHFEGRPMRDEYLMGQGGQLAGVGAHSYSKGNATGGSAEAARFRKTTAG